MGKKIAVIAFIALVALAAFAMMMRRAHMAAGSNLPLAAVSADGKQLTLPADVETAMGKLAENTAAQKVGDMIVVFSMNPYPAVTTQPTDFEVALQDAKGQAINDATVTLNMTMPEMWMPPNQPALDLISDGKYGAAGYFTMRGWWRIEVVIARGGATQSAFFDVGL